MPSIGGSQAEFMSSPEPSTGSLPHPRTSEGAQTKRRILRAAQRFFAARGYADSRLRDIASEAGANPALVGRYFGSKEKLFEAALADVLEVSRTTAVERAEFGKQVVASFVNSRPKRPNPLPMLVLATGDPVARQVAMRLLRELVLAPFVAYYGGEDAEERAAQFLAVTAGFFMYRLLYPLEPFQGRLAPRTRRWLEQTLQDIVDAP